MDGIGAGYSLDACGFDFGCCALERLAQGAFLDFDGKGVGLGLGAVVGEVDILHYVDVWARGALPGCGKGMCKMCDTCVQGVLLVRNGYAQKVGSMRTGGGIKDKGSAKHCGGQVDEPTART